MWLENLEVVRSFAGEDYKIDVIPPKKSKGSTFMV
jgi:hypothetical protein